jgi:two-component sensor histidine kinase
VRKPEVASALSEVVGQVQAIAQVYGLQVGASGLLRLRDVVKAITASVQRTFGQDIALAEPNDGDPVWILPEAESIPIALCINELLTNAIKHGSSAGAQVRCEVCCTDDGVRVDIVNAGRLSPDFDLARLPRGISGLGLVRSLLPKRSASLTIVQEGECVRSRIELQPPGVTRQAPLSAQEPAPGQQIALWPPAA